MEFKPVAEPQASESTWGVPTFFQQVRFAVQPDWRRTRKSKSPGDKT
jgi:hypothetical protein